MRYLSVCSGIEAASVAWHDLSWTPVAFSEIEAFPSAVLAHHYPNVPNWGDMTKFKEWPNESIDVLVGGTPCQSFSVAGLRKGLDDPRGNLMLTFLAIADRYRPKWVVWENVPGVLSSNGGRDFGSFLGGLGQLGYGWAYRVLDAQYFGVAQRRRRVFVVGCLGDWHRAAAVLFERESLSGNLAPSRKTGKAAPALSASGTGISRPGFNSEAGFYVAERTGTMTARLGHNAMGAPEVDGNFYIPTVTGCLNSVGGHAVPGNSLQDVDQGYLIPLQQPMTISFPWQMGGGIQMPIDKEITGSLIKNQTYAVAFNGDVVRTLNARHDSSPCADRGMDVVAVTQPIALADISSRDKTQNGAGWKDDGTMYTLDTTGLQGVAQPVAMRESGQGYWMEDVVAGTIDANMGMSGHANRPAVIKQQSMQVRRLTPRECERLQGFPDDYTDIPYRNKLARDGPRYKALGNSMAVPVMRWIGNRIQAVQDGVSSEILLDEGSKND